MRKRILTVILSVVAFLPFVSGQNKGRDIPFRMSIRANATIPHGISNKAFRRSFTGIYDVSVNCNYQIFHGFVAGIQYRTNEWKTPDNKIPGLNTYAQSHNGGIRVGYDFVRSEKSTAYIGLTAEEGLVKYFGLSIDPGTDLSKLEKIQYYRGVTVDAGMFFYTEGDFAIGFNAAVVMTDYAFDPYKIYLNQHKAYLPSDLNGTWSHFNIGFNIAYSFWTTDNRTTGRTGAPGRDSGD
jgi:hypothetical protein